jgi:hypothetical protein
MNKIDVEKGRFLDSLTPRRQPQYGVYLLFPFVTPIICRFVKCQPPETARIEAAGSLWAGFISYPSLILSLF